MTKTFTAEVNNGRLCFSESLEAFEGATVRVSIEAASEPIENQMVDFEGTLETEEDVHVPFIWKRMEVLDNVVIQDHGKLPPSGILPESERDV